MTAETQTYYRIIKQKWAASAFDGEGARLYGGRWNSKGRPCVYLTSSVSLATLEMLAHLNSTALLSTYTLFTVTIPVEHIRELGHAHLPTNWRADPAPSETAMIGDEWLASCDGVGLLLPSTITPSENNLLLNPTHAAFAACVKSAARSDYAFDKRLK
ncbi:RES domain-containing protein [Halopseudomonas litoralis]|uniref:RES domain-containing protein n=1 Tax=Halopseudomonas litoralis TaxID=797277 RepID=A0A1H1XGB2_9GAMM|nr:RES domain-containing protein [Halopseudomonas litoralis]SDT08220.1 RES domain-containing protein [Halopseudomonas litoralis]